MNERRFSLDELSALAEMPKRRVRFYIQEGLVDRPYGDSPRTAYYTTRHLEQLLAIRKWQRAGLSLGRIRELLRASEEGAPPPKPRGAGEVEVWSHLVVDDGVELHIEPRRAGLSPEQVRRLFREVMRLYREVKEGKEDACDGSEP
ncbi:MAG: MerR family transcriptional regulator [Zetaproteobacteria bacterium]|nr:MAG: MerR family transcriptional regulator [Zetaproteobacteria bacterium]